MFHFLTCSLKLGLSFQNIGGLILLIASSKFVVLDRCAASAILLSL